MSTDSHHGPVEERHHTSRFYRAHLQQALLQHVDPSTIHLRKGFKSLQLDQGTRKLSITFTDDTTVAADLVLGADGIHSPVRTFFVPTSSTAWTGWVTFRSVFPVSHLVGIPELPDEATHFWGPERTLFASKLGKDLFTVVGSYQSDPDDPDAPYKHSKWSSEGDLSILNEYYQDWSPLAKSMIAATPYTRVYPNMAAQGLETWVLGDGLVTLAGDAAHAHGGAFAAGGSLALDDAWAFASSIRHIFPDDATELPSGDDLRAALRLYEKTRKPHTDKLIKVVQEGNRKKVERLGKTETDEELRARMQSRADVSWIHEHDVVSTFQLVRDSLSRGQKQHRL